MHPGDIRFVLTIPFYSVQSPYRYFYDDAFTSLLAQYNYPSTYYIVHFRSPVKRFVFKTLPSLD